MIIEGIKFPARHLDSVQEQVRAGTYKPRAFFVDYRRPSFTIDLETYQRIFGTGAQTPAPARETKPYVPKVEPPRVHPADKLFEVYWCEQSQTHKARLK